MYVMFRFSFEEGADAHCEECLRNAIQICDSNAEAHHLFASYWLSKDDKEVTFTSCFNQNDHLNIQYVYCLHVWKS